MSKKKKLVFFPYTWEERYPTLKDGIFFIPDYFTGHSREIFDCNKYFNNDRKCIVEYCSGTGDWIIEKAKQDDSNYISIEKKIDRVDRIFNKRRKNDLDNRLLICCGDANIVSNIYLNDNSVDKVYINFPDPWPKDRHAKHRLNNKEFITSIFRTLKDKGELIITSDDKKFIDDLLINAKELNIFSSINLQAMDENYGFSFFRELWESKGRFCQTATLIK